MELYSNLSVEIDSQDAASVTSLVSDQMGEMVLCCQNVAREENLSSSDVEFEMLSLHQFTLEDIHQNENVAGLAMEFE